MVVVALVAAMIAHPTVLRCRRPSRGEDSAKPIVW